LAARITVSTLSLPPSGAVPQAISASPAPSVATRGSPGLASPSSAGAPKLPPALALVASSVTVGPYCCQAMTASPLPATAIAGYSSLPPVGEIVCGSVSGSPRPAVVLASMRYGGTGIPDSQAIAVCPPAPTAAASAKAYSEPLVSVCVEPKAPPAGRVIARAIVCEVPTLSSHARTASPAPFIATTGLLRLLDSLVTGMTVNVPPAGCQA
jgi:hypothetical protein